MTRYDTTKMHPLDAMRDKMKALEVEVERLGVALQKMSSWCMDAQAQLAAAQGQEPTGYLLPTTGKFVHAGTVMAGHAGTNWIKLYADPIPQQPAEQAQPERAPLDMEEINAEAREQHGDEAEEFGFRSGVRWAEKRHGIKQGGQW